MVTILVAGHLWGVAQSYLATPAGREAALLVSRRQELIENTKLELEKRMRPFQDIADKFEAEDRAMRARIAETKALREALPRMIDANKRAAQKAREDAERAKEDAERAKKPRL